MPDSEKNENELAKEVQSMRAEVESLRAQKNKLENRDQKALRDEARMEATSVLASGIGHEFNNLMLGVLGNVSLMRTDLGEDHPVAPLLDEIEVSARKADGLAQQMLAFARKGKYQPQSMNLNESVLRTVHHHEPNLPPNVKLERNLDAGLWDIIADPTQMSQVVMNLVTNAIEALESQGRLVVTTRNLGIDDLAAREHGDIQPGRYVLLTVEDDGVGMDEETLSQIFEPFYTTRPEGRGLGLSAVKSIIQNHNGQIQVDSEPEVGSSFRLYLPVVKVEGDEGAEKKLDLPTGKETVLLIDDEPVVLAVTREILERLGYKVLTAENGQEAVAVAQMFNGKIHLAVLDLGMPVMSGREVFPLLQKVRPDMKIIISSGFDIDRVAETILDAGAEDFILKPFQLTMFAPKIREVLDR